jgi:hypothetical protein
MTGKGRVKMAMGAEKWRAGAGLVNGGKMNGR